MKILHISTFDEGGAATAALRLNNGLRKEGVESNFLSLYKHDNQNTKAEIYTDFLRDSYKERIFSSIKFRIQSILYKEISNFSYPFSPFNVQDHPLVKDADIVHLHWVSKFVDISGFMSSMKKINKPVVWTLHDLNPITGGYHYHPFEGVSQGLYAKYYHIKKGAISSFNNIYMVSPSQWIYNLILDSDFVNKENVHIIKYGIDLRQFLPIHKKTAKKKLKINHDKKIILFLATDIEDKRKGLSYFLESIELLEKKKEYQFWCVGAGKFKVPLNLDFKFIGMVSDPQKLINIYSAADIFVIPSLEDNLPNAIIESLACGTPVVGFNTGGLPDLILNEYNGFLAIKENAKDLARKIDLLLKDSDLLNSFSINARAFVELHCDDQNQSKKYIELYRNILTQHKSKN